MIQLLITEEQNIVRKGIRMILELDRSIRIIDEAMNWQEAVEMIKRGDEIDVVLSDIDWPANDGIPILRALKEIGSDVKVLILTMEQKEEYVLRAFKEGASGYLLKSASADELIFALKHIHNGSKYLSADLSLERVNSLIKNMGTPAEKREHNFTARELLVLQLTAEGLTSCEIADQLNASNRTVEGYRKRLLDKTGMPNTAALIRYALKNQWVS